MNPMYYVWGIALLLGAQTLVAITVMLRAAFERRQNRRKKD